MMEEPPVTAHDTQPRVCPNCGAKVSSRAKTCLLCGADLQVALAPAQEQPVPPTAPPRPKITLKGILIQILLTIAGLVLLIVIIWGFSAVVSGASHAVPAVTPTLEPSPTLAAVSGSTHTPTPAPISAASATPIPPLQHTIKAGETLSGIAEQYPCVTVEDIQALNNLGSDDILQVGQVLLIPSGCTTPTPSTPAKGPGECTIVHVVQEGETLLWIAQHYGVSMFTIQNLNNITNPDELKPGQQLTVPICPTATPTQGPPPTSTPLAKYAPPPLLSPLDGVHFEGAGVPILLQWAATVLLRPDEWYQVTLDHIGSGQPPTTFRTKTTALYVPAELYPATQSSQRTFQWRVDIVRQIDTQPTFEDASSPGEIRSFMWLLPLATPTPTPGPS